MMYNKPSRWWNKEIIPARKRVAPSPLLRRIWRVFGILILLALCLFAFWRIRLYRDVNNRFARIRAAGFPVSGAELNAWRAPVPDAENGALVLTQAFALFRTFPDRRSNEVYHANILNRTNEWSAETHELVAAYVQTNAPALAKVREALLLSRFRYPVDFSYGPQSELPHLPALIDMARLWALKAALDAEEGRTDEWPELVELQLKIAGTLDDEPTDISYLTRNSIIRIAAQVAERSLNRASPGDQACKKLQSAFAHAGETNLLPLALVGERAMTIPIFRMSWKESQSFSQAYEPDGQPRKRVQYSGKPMIFLSLTGILERDLDFYLQTMEKSISLAALPFPGSLALTNYLESASIVARSNLYIFSGMFLPSLSRTIVREASAQALIKLATTSLAVERFRLDRGLLPNDLKELTPQFLDVIPMDPFDGAPVRYRRLARGYVIYSVGADGHDDGGREPPEFRKSNDKTTYDLTFVVER
jgi:hypothetical protein